jgi:hypothetical protein
MNTTTPKDVEGCDQTSAAFSVSMMAVNATGQVRLALAVSISISNGHVRHSPNAAPLPLVRCSLFVTDNNDATWTVLEVIILFL